MDENLEKSLTNDDKGIELSEKSLGERIMGFVPNRNNFTGQVTVEVHCKNGEVRDVYITHRKKLYRKKL